VYGNSPNVPYREVEQGLKPTSFYGATKLSNEFLASALSRNTKTSTRGLRFFTVYGPWGRPDMAYFRMVRSLLLEREFYLYGDGALKRDFTYIDDAVDSVVSLTQQVLTQGEPFSDVVNVGGGNNYSILELVSVVNNLSQRNLKIQIREAFAGDVKQTLADSSRLLELTGKIPMTKLADGINKVYQWSASDPIISHIKNWD
jgi:UDP-glucuronate 4-epimerase